MRTHSERLSALDCSFLAWESATAQMHVACTLVFDSGPLATLDGGVDLETLRKAVRSALPHIPRYRQKLAWIPVSGSAAWVDDDGFELDNHLRHAALPRPGSRRQLQELSAWIVQQPLDRARPLWEIWIVEGLAGGRFAVVAKVHHCMVDGIAGMQLLQRLLSPDPNAAFGEGWLPEPRRAPGELALLAKDLRRRAELPAVLLRGMRKAGGAVRREAVAQLGAFARSLAPLARRATATPWNGPLGPQRRLDGFATDLAEARAAGRRLGATVNDLVLATVCGAVRRALPREGLEPRDVRFRVLAPVSVRNDDECGALGNRVSVWMVDLPVGEPQPLRRLARIREQTAALKRSRSALGAKLLADVADWTWSSLPAMGARVATRLPAFNMIVTNVPGPQIPLYLAGARLLEALPVAPLFDRVGMNLALISYAGRLFWGLNADPGRVRDPAGFREDLEHAFAEIVRSEAPRPRRVELAAARCAGWAR